MQMRHRHRVLEFELFHQHGSDFLVEAVLQARSFFRAVTGCFRSALLFLLGPTLFFFFIFSHNSALSY